MKIFYPIAELSIKVFSKNELLIRDKIVYKSCNRYNRKILNNIL